LNPSTLKSRKNEAQNRFLVGFMKKTSSILAIKPFISMFGQIRKVAVTYSKTYVENEKLTNHVVKISKQVEGL
jgi:hypothetical protein